MPSLEGLSAPRAPIKLCASILGLVNAAYEDQRAEQGTATVAHVSQEVGSPNTSKAYKDGKPIAALGNDRPPWSEDGKHFRKAMM